MVPRLQFNLFRERARHTHSKATKFKLCHLNRRNVNPAAVMSLTDAGPWLPLLPYKCGNVNLTASLDATTMHAALVFSSGDA